MASLFVLFFVVALAALFIMNQLERIDRMKSDKELQDKMYHMNRRLLVIERSDN
jgi:hypothetical protein